jgi:hypothetical protein
MRAHARRTRKIDTIVDRRACTEYLGILMMERRASRL